MQDSSSWPHKQTPKSDSLSIKGNRFAPNLIRLALNGVSDIAKSSRQTSRNV